MEQTKWIIFVEIAYFIFIIGVCLRIIWDTQSVTKTLAYLLLVVFLPFFGAIIYFSFGINYRKRKTYIRKLQADEPLEQEYRKMLEAEMAELPFSHNHSIIHNMALIKMLTNPRSGIYSPIVHHNQVELLINGESFFPILLDRLAKAKEHIHIEFYIYENDKIGNAIKDILIRKAKEGVAVRFIYDDFGSKGIRRVFVRELRESGIMAFPFNKIRMIALANRLNYRNHRKIVVIDGKTSFVGGINVSDKYINDKNFDLYWRDTHLLINGQASHLLQKVFISDWNFCSNENLMIKREFFPLIDKEEKWQSSLQIVSSGPDSETSSILHAIIKAINLAEKEILITTPYFIPEESLQQALIFAALSGIDVRLLVPKVGDSFFVNLASQAYYEDLLRAGVRIFRYTKGFVHAKTFVTDKKLASVGTANMDLRSFDLNFEVTALIYDEKKAIELADIFQDDLKGTEELYLKDWLNRPKVIKLAERLLRLLSPLL